MIGPGKYDDLTSAMRLATEAEAIAVIVVGGKLGSGFSCQALDPAMLPVMARAMRTAADQMERDYKENQKAPGN